jgi:hypothetical protein
VVLDEQGQTTLADQTASPTGDEDDRTRVRAPQAVQAQTRAPERTPPPAYPPLSGSTSIPAAGHTTVTSPRPGAAAAMAGTAPAGTASPGGVADDLADEGTVRVDRNRAREAAAEPGFAPAPTGDRTEISPRALLTGVALVVALLVGVVVWAVAFRGDGDPAQPPPPSVVAGPTDDDPVSVPQVPEMKVQAGPGTVSFSWTYAAPAKGDTFRFRQAATVEALADATFVPSTSATRTVRVAKGTQVCAQALVARKGSSSDYSKPACEKAG